MRVPPLMKPYGSAVGRVNFIPDKYLKNKIVVDIGSGTGWFGIYALKKSVRKIILIEPSKEANGIAAEYLKGKKVEIMQGFAYPLPLRDSSVDTIVCWEVLEHIPKNNELKLFREINRVLKTNGHMFLSTPYASFISKVTDPAWWLIGHRHYSLKKLKSFGQKTNLTLNEIKIQGGYLSILYNLNMYFSKWILRREPILKNKLQSLSTREYLDNNGFVTIFAHFTKHKV